MAGTAVLGRLTWLVAEVAETVTETPHVRTVTLDVPGWPGHRAGQHVDVRLTAEDGYQAERSYSLASAPGDPPALTVERLEDGEVSPYLVDEAAPGDRFELRLGWEGWLDALVSAFINREIAITGIDKTVAAIYRAGGWVLCTRVGVMARCAARPWATPATTRPSAAR